MKNLFLLLFIPYLMFSQTQIGNDIYGDGFNNMIGAFEQTKISGDGSTIIIGGSSNEMNPGGNARVLKNTSGTWIQVGSELEAQTDRDSFGTVVDISDNGNIVAVGAMGFNPLNINGYIKVFENVSDEWIQVGNTIGQNESAWKFSLSLDGTKIVIQSSASVKVFENISNIWTQVGSDVVPEDSLDFSVPTISPDGNTIALSSRRLDGFDPNIGVMFFTHIISIYKYISGDWIQIGQAIEGDEYNDRFGTSLEFSLNGNIIAIGAPHSSANGSFSGKVKVFKNVNNSWELVGEEIVGFASIDRFGIALDMSLNGRILAIGAFGNSDNGDSSGHVRVFQNIEDTWMHMGEAIRGDSSFDFFGKSVGLSSNGTTLAIGGDGYDYIEDLEGIVRVFNLSEILSTNFIEIKNSTVLYPNPASKNVQIELDDSLVLKGVILYDMLGKEVLKSTVKSINISSLPAGVYNVIIQTNEGVAAKQLIVK